MSLRCACFCLFVGVSAVGSSDQLLLKQSSRFPFENRASRSHAFDSSGFHSSDDFRLLGGGEITNVNWQGFLANGNTFPNENVSGWTLSISEDLGGSPGSVLFETTALSDSVSTRLVDTTSFGGRTVSVYDHSFDLPNAFTANADTKYWLSISATSDDRWMWMSGFGDDDQMRRTSLSSGNTSNVTHDAHFELWGNRTGDLPSNGQLVPNLSRVDTAMHDFMQSNTIEAAAVGVMRDGEFVFQRSYGWQDESHLTELPPDAMMRLASISKPITAATIRELASEGALSLSSNVFDLGQPGGGILQIEPFGGLGDERLKDVSVRDLLRHRGGWDRTISPDYAFWDLEIASQMGLASPPGPENKASFVMGQPLDHRPGSTFAYSNIGFMMLGLVIEEVTGKEYIDVVHEKVFAPLGVPQSEVEAGRTFPNDRNPREPWYDQPARWEAVNVYDPNGEHVPWPDGGWDHEGADAYGGVIASTKALLKFADEYRLWGDSIGRRRNTNESDSAFWAHDGSLPGTNTILVQRGDGTNFVVLLNRRSASIDQYITEIGNQLFELFATRNIDWPDALIFAGDGSGDGWVTPDDIEFFSMATVLSKQDFESAYPDAQFTALDANLDGYINRHDLPGFYQALLDNHNSVAQLELFTVRGDINGDWQLDVTDVNLQLDAIVKGNSVIDIDLIDGTNHDDLGVLVKNIFGTYFGDANLDGEFNSGDLVTVFTTGKFETNETANWGEGDWNADGVFSSGDFVTAFADGGFELGPRVAQSIAEPQSHARLLPLFFLAAWFRRRQRSTSRR